MTTSEKTISLLLPTRGRPQQCLNFLNSLANKANNTKHIEVILCVDEDDRTSHNLSLDGLSTSIIIRPRQTMGKYNTDCLREATGDIIFLVNDDVEVKTQNWDQNVREMDAQYPDGIYLGYPNDLFKGKKQPTFPILSRTLCNLLKNPFPGTYKGSFIEYHLLDIFKRLERKKIHRIHYLKNTIFEHMHHRLGKGTYDDTYKQRERFGDDLVFITEDENRRHQAEKIIAYLENRAPVIPPQQIDNNSQTSPNQLLLSYLIKIAFSRDQIPIRWQLFLLWWFPTRYVFSIIKQIIRFSLARKRQ